MSFTEKLASMQAQNDSWLCVGLDPTPSRLPLEGIWKWDEPVLPFNKRIIDATKDLVCAYKPNLGFYFQWGAAGIIALERTIAYIPDEIPVILDCKIGDIGHTAQAWAAGLFDHWGVDAITAHPYIGRDAIEPMLRDRAEKAVFLLARTSNRSGPEFQGDLRSGDSLAASVLRASGEWDVDGTLGYVLGATYPAELAAARRLAPEAPFLVPGIGAQGGDLAAAVRDGGSERVGPVISASRSVIYAGTGLDFADKAREAAERLRRAINEARGANWPEAGSEPGFRPGSIGEVSSRIGFDVRELIMSGYSDAQINGVLTGRFTLSELFQMQPEGR